MGVIHVDTIVTHIDGGSRGFSMPFLVDSGATDTMVPAEKLEAIGVKREGSRLYELADGSVVSYETGYAFISVNGEKVAANVVFGKDGCEPLLGVTVLESAGFVIDPVRRLLMKAESIPLK